MKEILSILFNLLLFTKIITIDVMKFGETKKSSLGYIIFNSTNIKEGENIKFKIKAYSFIQNKISYYYFDNLENIDIINIDNINLYYKNFTNNNSSKEAQFEVNNFIIYKSSREYAIYEGKYLKIFYYTNDSYAEITSIKEEETKNEEKKEEDKKKNQKIYLLFLLILLGLLYWIYDYKKKKKKQIKKLEKEKEKQSQDLHLMELEINKKNDAFEAIKNENERLENKANKMEAERKELEKAEEERKKQEENERKKFLNYIEKTKKKFPYVEDMVIIKEGKVNINELISLIIQSGDQSIQCIVICKKTEIFNNVINKVFEKNPVFKNYSNYFLCNGSIVYEYKSLEENKIKDEDAILLYKKEDDE